MRIKIQQRDMSQQIRMETLKRAERHFGYDDPRIVHFLLDIAEPFLRKPAVPGGAEPHLKRAYIIKKKAGQIKDLDMADVIHGLAECFHFTGKLQQAEAYYKRALSIREKFLGSDHSLVGLSLNGLAAIRFQLGRGEEAQIAYQRAARIWEVDFNEKWGPELVAHPNPEFEAIRSRLTATQTELRDQRNQLLIEELRQKKACFIATEVFGDPDHEKVELLRDFRDEVLMKSRPGRSFVQSYYRHGPQAAGFLHDRPRLSGIVRSFLEVMLPLLDRMRSRAS